MDLKELKEQFNRSLMQATGYLYSRQVADETRYCVWDGQSPDGRKRRDFLDEEPFPWEGAADTRQRYIDSKCKEVVDMQMNAIKRASFQAVPIESANATEATVIAQVLNYFLYNRIAQEWLRELELTLQWSASYGLSAGFVYWRQDIDTDEVVITLQDFIQLASQDDSVKGLLIRLQETQGELDDEDKEVAEMVFEQYFGGANPKKCLKDLVKNGSFTYEQEYLKENRPAIKGMRFYEDFFLPANSYCIPDARWVVVRELLSTTEVEERAKLQNWDDDFKKQIQAMVGKSILGSTYVNTWRQRITQNAFIDDVEDLCELFTAYSKEWEGKKLRMWKTIFHPMVDFEGPREPYEYEHGKFPLVEFRFEVLARNLLQSRGIPELMETVQNELKAQRDSRIDRTSISTLPPMKVPANRGRTQYNIGPASQIPVAPNQDVGWLNPPPETNDSVEAEMTLLQSASDYLGLTMEGVDPNKVANRTQRYVDQALLPVTEMCRQMFQLCQQYLSQDEFDRIAGATGVQVNQSKIDIQNEYDIRIEFDSRNLNMEQLEQKMELIGQLVAQDTSGAVDKDFIIRYAFQAIDPVLARDGLRPPGSVSQQEINDEQDSLAKIAVGIEPPMVPQGQNYPLRLQVIQNTLKGSPKLQKEIFADPDSRALLENRIKFLTFQVQQQQNAQTGKVGAQPLQPNPA
jgi:hypothetical protein